MTCLCGEHGSKIWSAGQGVQCSGAFCLLAYVLTGTQKPKQGRHGAFRLGVCLEAWCPLIRGGRHSHPATNERKGFFCRMAVECIDDLCNPNKWRRDSCRDFVIVLCPDSSLQYRPVMFGHWKCSCMYMISMWQKLLFSEVTDDSFALAQEACLTCLLVSSKMADVR